MATNVRNSSIGMCLLSYRRCIVTRQSVQRADPLRKASHEGQLPCQPHVHDDLPPLHRYLVGGMELTAKRVHGIQLELVADDAEVLRSTAATAPGSRRD